MAPDLLPVSGVMHKVISSKLGLEALEMPPTIFSLLIHLEINSIDHFVYEMSENGKTCPSQFPKALFDFFRMTIKFHQHP